MHCRCYGHLHVYGMRMQCPLHSGLDCTGLLTPDIWLVLDVSQVLVTFTKLTACLPCNIGNCDQHLEIKCATLPCCLRHVAAAFAWVHSILGVLVQHDHLCTVSVIHKNVINAGVLESVLRASLQTRPRPVTSTTLPIEL